MCWIIGENKIVTTNNDLLLMAQRFRWKSVFKQKQLTEADTPLVAGGQVL
jgi:hypothetical protein